MNNKVNFLRGTSAEYESSTKDNDTFYYTTDDEKLYLGNKEITGGGVTIDNALSDTSKNPVQNKVITNALNTKANLTDIPTALPADGGNADTVDGKHASEFMQFLGDFRSGSILDTILTLNSSGYIYFGGSNCTDMPVGGGYFFGEVREHSTLYEIIATNIGTGAVYTNRCNNSHVWYGWKNVADGGNAATVNGLTVQTAVPANAKFTDTTYGAATASTTGLVTTGAQTFAGNKAFNGQVIPAGASAVGTAQARKIYAGTSDMTAGTTALETGAIYLVYE